MFGLLTGPPAFHWIWPVPNEVSAAGGVHGVPAGEGFCGGVTPPSRPRRGGTSAG